MRRVLRVNQQLALEYCSRVQHPALFMEMRLGKTLVSIRSARIKRSRRNLIVAPYSAFYGWENDLKLDGELNFGLVVLEGSRVRRLDNLQKGWECGAKWFMINKEGHLALPEIAEYPWDSVYLDESTCIKGNRTAISEFFIDNFRSVSHRYILSGLPAPESELDYFNQCRFLDEQIFDEKDYWEFKKKNFGVLDFKILVSPRGQKYITSRLAQYCLFQTRKEFNLGGIKIYERRYVQFSSHARETYQKMCDKFLLEVGDSLKDSTVYTITSRTWMRRLCGGFVEEDFIFDGKFRELQYLLRNDLHSSQVIVWCHFTDEITMIVDKLEQEGIKCGAIYGEVAQPERRALAASFHEGLFRVLVAQPACAKYGLDLSCTTIMIYYSSPEGFETRSQSEDRTVNVSRNDSCLIIDLVVQDTVDEDILESLVNKEGTFELNRRIIKRLQKERNLA